MTSRQRRGLETGSQVYSNISHSTLQNTSNDQTRPAKVHNPIIIYKGKTNLNFTEARDSERQWQYQKKHCLKLKAATNDRQIR